MINGFSTMIRMRMKRYLFRTLISLTIIDKQIAYGFNLSMNNKATSCQLVVINILIYGSINKEKPLTAKLRLKEALIMLGIMKKIMYKWLLHK